MATGKEIKRLRGKVSAAVVAAAIGVSVDKLRKWEERDTDPSDTGDISNVESYFGVPLNKLHTLQSFEFVKTNSTVTKNPTPSTSLDELIYSNKVLAEANRRLADAHYIISEANKELVTMTKEAMGWKQPESNNKKEPDKNLLPKIGEGGAVDIREKSQKNQPKK